MTLPDLITFTPKLNLFHQFKNLHRIAHFIDKIQSVVEILEDKAWVRAPETEDLNHFFTARGMYWKGANRLLTDMWVSYMENGYVLVHKLESWKHAHGELAVNTTMHYSDGAVGSLRVLPAAFIRRMDVDESGGMLNGIYIDPAFQFYCQGKSYLRRNEFLYMQDFNPLDQFVRPRTMLDKLRSSAIELKPDYYQIETRVAAQILGVPTELLFESSKGKVSDQERLQKLLSQYLEMTLLPTLERLKFAFHQLGMVHTMRIRFDTADWLDWLMETWNEQAAVLPVQAIALSPMSIEAIDPG